MDQDHRVAREFVYGVLYNSRDLSTAARRQIMQKLLKCIKMSGGACAQCKRVEEGKG